MATSSFPKKIKIFKSIFEIALIFNSKLQTLFMYLRI
jgi:hypothetical protein